MESTRNVIGELAARLNLSIIRRPSYRPTKTTFATNGTVKRLRSGVMTEHVRAIRKRAVLGVHMEGQGLDNINALMSRKVS
jgi:hypothetical protein